MKCVHPLKIKQGTLPCGKCMACRITITTELSMRFWHERLSRPDDWAYFITLTYDEEHNPLCVSKDVAQRWLKRLRYFSPGKKITYLLGAEYGDETMRPHYHICTIGYTPSKLINYRADRYTSTELVRSWPYGMTDIELLEGESKVRYAIKYVTQVDTRKFKSLGLPLPFRLLSKGLGKNWIVSNAAEIASRGGLLRKGKFMHLPRYYKDKMVMPDKLFFQRKAEEHLERYKDDVDNIEIRIQSELEQQESNLESRQLKIR